MPTALLSSGFVLASAVAFLLWRDMENRADGESDEGCDVDRMGDWFLSLSSRTTTDGVASASSDEGAAAAASRTIRARLLLHLAVFGALCLAGQYAGYHLSSRAPFLGLSAAAVNLHNVLACVSALMKEEGGRATMMRAAMTTPLRSLPSEERKDRDRRRLELTPFLFRLGAIVACVRCIPVCKLIFTLASGLLSGGVSESTAIVSNARQLSLQVASLARLTLFAGASNALYTSFSAYHCSFRHHPFFATLSGMLGLGCLSVGGAMLFESVVSLSSSANAILSQAPLGGVLLMTFGMFATWNSVMGFEHHLRCSGLTGKRGVKS
ncbi:hypothetical protein ACHAW5_004320 [Stephanodiscus triporus]|uniref:Solute carrier family 40 protein n=1 Tax=Stephanodiscus triporus TaxID=2934178 RepID=A0ABD3MXL1_9STRA